MRCGHKFRKRHWWATARLAKGSAAPSRLIPSAKIRTGMKKRYTKPIELAHSVTMKFRVRMAEQQRIKTDAAEAGRTVSDYIRGRLVNSKPRTHKATPERATLIRGLSELGKIGSNINQIARALNRSQISDREHVPMELIERILHELQTISAKLVRILSDGDPR
jgi:mobilization protein NikA